MFFFPAEKDQFVGVSFVLLDFRKKWQYLEKTKIYVIKKIYFRKE